MKKWIIRIAIFIVILIAILAGVFFFMNREKEEILVDMDEATLPTISFMTAGKEANMLVGHKKEMNVASMRDTIAICDEKDSLKMKVSYNDSGYDSLKYEVFTLDGKKLLHEDTVDTLEGEINLSFKSVLKNDDEALLKLTLSKNDSELYYYTRVVNDHGYHVKECLTYMEELHTNMFKIENEDAVKKVMESNASGDNSTLQHVTIHSDLKHAMWGDLKPELVGNIQFEIKEAKAAYTSVLLKYQVYCEGDNNKQERYNVKEFFKVTYNEERMYLLEYDRTMEEVFDTSNVVLGDKGVILGIADENLEYKTNAEGTIVAFVQANELWNYDKEKETFTLLFRFSTSENEDIRNLTDAHSIQLVTMENSGNLTFSVCGYMNRGMHEGESGIAIYYYDASKNAIEEKAFIPSIESWLVAEKELSELAFYNQKQDVLYVMANGTLFKVSLKEEEHTVLMEGLQKGQYVVSEDGRLLAYQKKKEGVTKTEIWDFVKDSKKEVSANAREIVLPLGFIGSDFIYGVSKVEDAGYDVVGNPVYGMSRLEILNEKNEVVKTYQKEGVYILEVTIGTSQIVLKQGIKTGDVYKETSEDYITNNETSTKELIELDSYWTDLKESQYRFVFSNGIKNKQAETVQTKQVLKEEATILAVEQNDNTEYFYVYGKGEQAGVFENAGDAIALADSLSGVVISPGQNYAWEDGNRVPWYHNFEVSRFTQKEDETTLVACVKKVLAYEGKSVDVVAEMKTSSVEKILEKYLETEVLLLRGCSAKDMFYLIDKGVPVIALRDGESAILLIGYAAKTVTYIEPSSGNISTGSIEKVDAMLEGSGNTFITYVR